MIQLAKSLFGRRLSLFVATLFITAIVPQISGVRSASADDGGYPWIGATCVDGTNCSSTYNWGYGLPCPSNDTNCLSYPYPSSKPYSAGMGDTWGYGVRNCTSYAAWKENQVFPGQTTVVGGWGNASNFPNKAPGSDVHAASGYTPQVGDLAIWNSPSPWGHVAYVSGVNSGIASLYEYNSGFPLDSGGHAQWGMFYSGRTTASNSAGTPDYYIHFGTVGGGGGTTSYTTPSALARDSGDMDTFYQSSSGNSLVDRYWNSTYGWNSTSWANNIASTPSAIARDSNDMDVFFRDTNSNLVDEHWNSVNGWAATTLISNGTVTGVPTAVARDSGDMDVFYKDSSGNLAVAYWSATGGWGSTNWADGLSGDPAVLSRNSGDMQVFFRSSGNLKDEYWSATGGWGLASLVTGIAGDPGVTSPDGSHMDVFYQGPSNDLYDEWFDASLGWFSSSWATPINGKPSPISRDSSDMDVLARSSSNNLVDQYWNATNGWGGTTLDGSGSLQTDPSAIARDSGDMDVFYARGNNLYDEHWNSVNGWGSTSWGW